MHALFRFYLRAPWASATLTINEKWKRRRKKKYDRRESKTKRKRSRTVTEILRLLVLECLN